MKQFFIIFSIFFICSAIFADEKSQDSKLTLTVEAANGTFNGSSLEGDEVFLQLYKDQKLLNDLTDKLNKDNKAFFTVPSDANMFAVASVKHQKTMFYGQPVEVGQNPVTSRVTAFDVSNDSSSLSVSTHHFIIKQDADALKITEFMLLKNSSDKAVSSGHKDKNEKTVALEIMLPQGFSNLECSSYFEPDAIVVTNQGFYDTMAIAPGEYEVIFSYNIDVKSETVNIIKKLSLPTVDLVIFSQSSEAKIQGLNFDKQVISAGGNPMEYYKADNLPSGEQIKFQITGFKQSDTGANSWVIMSVVFGLIAVLAAARILLRKNPTVRFDR